MVIEINFTYLQIHTMYFASTVAKSIPSIIANKPSDGYRSLMSVYFRPLRCCIYRLIDSRESTLKTIAVKQKEKLGHQVVRATEQATNAAPNHINIRFSYFQVLLG